MGPFFASQGQGRAGQGRAGQGRVEQGSVGQGSVVGQCRAETGREGQGRTLRYCSLYLQNNYLFLEEAQMLLKQAVRQSKKRKSNLPLEQFTCSRNKKLKSISPRTKNVFQEQKSKVNFSWNKECVLGTKKQSKLLLEQVICSRNKKSKVHCSWNK